jgi:hypothetical protein
MKINALFSSIFPDAISDHLINGIGITCLAIRIFGTATSPEFIKHINADVLCAGVKC